jgi:L,D-peptidoglycan transpeptidase YkuD (ErfK/YbiS/YcfS/YnhG family)
MQLFYQSLHARVSSTIDAGHRHGKTVEILSPGLFLRRLLQLELGNGGFRVRHSVLEENVGERGFDAEKEEKDMER